MILTDYHVHSSISPDASSSMKEMCESAIQRVWRKSHSQTTMNVWISANHILYLHLPI